MKLDLKDKKLIYELDIDSRQPASQLARKIGISKQGCTFKINNLVKNKVIISFPTVINTPLIGHLSFRMYFKLIDVSPPEEQEFRDYLIQHPEVPWVVGSEGKWDYIVVVFPSDFEAFEKFNLELNNIYGKFIEKKDIALVTQANHFRAGYILGQKRDLLPLVYAGQPKKVVELDIVEKNILTLLARNARYPLVEISKLINVPAKNIAYRIDKLKSMGVIEGFTLMVDLGQIGFERYKMFIRSKNLSEKTERSFIQYARMHPYLLYYSKSIGENDVELEFVVRNGNHLREIIADIRNKFGEVIKSYETLKIYQEFKLNYYPWGKIKK
ncbi:MAG: Lrp/AsnC family transcriptional regulator [Candidatus Woesearchaeota archaeon]